MPYIVYVDYQEERVLPEGAEHFKSLEKALERANELKEEFQYSDDWELSEEFDEGELTDSENDVLFIHKITGMEAYVSIHSFVFCDEEDDCDFIKLRLSITQPQIEELRKHLLYNGYHVTWEADDVILVVEDEVDYVKTILYDREICFWEDREDD